MKDRSESFNRSFLIILAYGIGFGLGYITRLGNPKIFFSFYHSEQQIFANYGINLKDLLDLLFITPIFAIISFILLRRILEDSAFKEMSKKKINCFYYIYLIAIVFFAYGNMIHITMNRLNSDIADIYNTEAFYYSVYFLDEFWGHHLIEIGFFIIFTEFTFLHTFSLINNAPETDQRTKLMSRNQKSWNAILGIVFGIATALLYLEGQSAFLFLILNPIFCLILIIYNNKHNIPLKENSLLMLFLLMTISFAITTIIWGILTGIKPAYPFFYQNSEVDIFKL